MSIESHIKDGIREIDDFPKKGISFKDICPLFYNQKLCSEIVDSFIQKIDTKIDAIAGIESRGFLFGMLLANKLNVPFVMIRKAGKLPSETISEEYELEYGHAKIELQKDAIKSGWNVLIHDDLLATGGTALASAKLLKKAGANIAGFNFVVELEFLKGKSKLITYTNNITCLAQY